MKRTRVHEDARDFGVKADWYNHENLVEVEKVNPTRVVGRKRFPAAYFVAIEEWQTDPMADFNASEWVRIETVGPFATKKQAAEWAKAYDEQMFQSW